MVNVEAEVLEIIGVAIALCFIVVVGTLLYRLHILRGENRNLANQELTKNLIDDEKQNADTHTGTEQQPEEEEISEMVKVNPLHGIRTSVLKKKSDAFDYDLDLSAYEKTRTYISPDQKMNLTQTAGDEDFSHPTHPSYYPEATNNHMHST